MFLRVTSWIKSKSFANVKDTVEYSNVKDTVEYLLGSDISEKMAAILPDVNELMDEDKVDKENLDAPTFSNIPSAGVSKLFPWRATLLIFQRPVGHGCGE